MSNEVDGLESRMLLAMGVLHTSKELIEHLRAMLDRTKGHLYTDRYERADRLAEALDHLAPVDTFTTRRLSGGVISLPTGRVCVTDAYLASEYPPLNRIVPPGEYPIEMVVSRSVGGAETTAFLVVRFSEDQISEWEPATAISPDDPCYMDESPNQFVQEGGSGIFSSEAGEIHYDLYRTNESKHVKFIRGLEINDGPIGWVNYCPKKSKANVFIGEGGRGDGFVSCFFGLSASGRVVVLVVDYGIASPRE